MADLQAVPDTMREQPRWVVWRSEERNGQKTKVPYQPHQPNKKASSTDPATWADLDTAQAAVERHGFNGVGFMFEGSGLVGVDLDHCYLNGELRPWAMEIWERFFAVSYCDVSPSGDGLHFITQGRVPADGWKKQECIRGLSGNRIEMYDSGRYFTVTGNTNGEPQTIGDGQAAIEWLQAEHAKRKPEKKRQDATREPTATQADPETMGLEDMVLIDQARQAVNGAKFDALMRGDLSEHGDDHSGADMALCSILAFWTRNPAQIDRIFRTSGLMRDKWDSRRGPSTYGADTIRKALDFVPPGEAEQTANVSPREKLKSLIVQKEYVAMLGKEMWLLQNLIIKGQITTIIAKSGGGKTSVFFDYVVPWIINSHDMTVFYFDCDSPASDHDTMLCKAEAMGPRCQWINPLTHGKGPEVLVDALKEFVASGERLDDAFFVLDTLKKFIDMLDKKSVKPFFSLLRQLTALGATIALLGHANKHRDNDGNLVFEGVGDVVSDTDAMIIFERVKSADGGIDITTICDPDKGAKVRGLYKPMSFHVAPDRTVTLCKDVVAVPDYSKDAAKRGRLTEEMIEERIREFLEDQEGVVHQKQILDDFKGEPGASFHAVRKVLTACAINEHEATGKGQIFVRAAGLYNQKLYGVVR